jgi:peptidylprolyl isomerase
MIKTHKQEESMESAKSGDQVKIHYTGRLNDGTIFDSSRERDPLEFTAGGKEIIPGLSVAVVGMKPGDSKTVVIPPEEAFGPHHPERSQKIELKFLPEGIQVGQPLQAESANQAEPLTVWVTEIGDDYAVIDANHPLAGKELTFDIEMVGLDAG